MKNAKAYDPTIWEGHFVGARCFRSLADNEIMIHGFIAVDYFSWYSKMIENLELLLNNDKNPLNSQSKIILRLTYVIQEASIHALNPSRVYVNSGRLQGCRLHKVESRNDLGVFYSKNSAGSHITFETDGVGINDLRPLLIKDREGESVHASRREGLIYTFPPMTTTKIVAIEAGKALPVVPSTDIKVTDALPLETANI